MSYKSSLIRLKQNLRLSGVKSVCKIVTIICISILTFYFLLNDSRMQDAGLLFVLDFRRYVLQNIGGTVIFCFSSEVFIEVVPSPNY